MDSHNKNAVTLIKMLKKIIISFVLAIIIVAGFGMYLYFKPGQRFQNVKPDLIVNASDIINDFVVSEESANSKYLNKVVEVNGTVHDISEEEKGMTSINLSVNDQSAMISCSMDSTGIDAYSNIETGDNIRIKGLCSGMLMDVILVKCVIVN